MRHFWTIASLILLHRSATTHGDQRTLDHSSRCGDWVFFLFKIVLGFISCIVLRCGKSFNGLVCTGICPRKCNAKSNARTEQRFDFDKKWLTRMYGRKAGTSSQSFPIVPRTRFKPSIWIFLRRRRRRISFRGSSTVRCPVSTLISIEVMIAKRRKKIVNCVQTRFEKFDANLLWINFLQECWCVWSCCRRSSECTRRDRTENRRVSVQWARCLLQIQNSKINNSWIKL